MEPVENKPKKDLDKDWWHQGVRMFAQATGWIAFPVIGALFLGQWLDQKYDTGQLYFFSLTALAFIISCVGIGMTGVKYMKEIENINKNNKIEESKDKNERRIDRT